MAGVAWTLICFARHRESPSNWTVASIWVTRTPTGETVVKMTCFRRTVIWFLAEDVGKRLDQVLDGIFRAYHIKGAGT
jgi:hypothetical protein